MTEAVQDSSNLWLGQLSTPTSLEAGFAGSLYLSDLGSSLLWNPATQIDPLNLSDFYIPLPTDAAKRVSVEERLKVQSLTLYAAERGLPVDEKTALALMRECDITTLVVSDAEFEPAWLAPYIETSLVDPRSGQRLVTLKPWD